MNSAPVELGAKHVPASLGSNRVKGTRHTQRFGVQISHGRFQRLVAHCALDGSRIGPTIQAMRCVGMTQFMGQDE